MPLNTHSWCRHNIQNSLLDFCYVVWSIKSTLQNWAGLVFHSDEHIQLPCFALWKTRKTICSENPNLSDKSSAFSLGKNYCAFREARSKWQDCLSFTRRGHLSRRAGDQFRTEWKLKAAEFWRAATWWPRGHKNKAGNRVHNVCV